MPEAMRACALDLGLVEDNLDAASAPIVRNGRQLRSTVPKEVI